MTRSASLSRPGAEFDAFLYAPIGEEGNGMLLSVLSALARLDVDPWHEAARLARLPPKTATQRLLSLILAVPGAPPAQSDPETIAARLVGLLPRPASSKTSSPAAPAVVGRAINSWSVTIAVYIVFALGAHLIMERPQPPVQLGGAPTLASSRGSHRDAASESPAVTIGGGETNNGEIK